MSKSNNSNYSKRSTPPTGKATNTNSRKRTSTSRPISGRDDRAKDRMEHNPGGPGYVDALAASLNDPEWYAATPELLMDAASISYNAPVGAPIHLMRGAVTPGVDVPGNYPSVPGIMTFKTAIIPGYSIDNQSPINFATQNLYAFDRYVNSGHANYDKPDYMLYYLALDSAYSLVAWMRRIYGQLMLSSQYNYYMLRAMIESEGVSYDDFSRHIVDLRYFINQYQLKLGAYVIPTDLAFFTRHMWMFSNVYLDEPNQKAQMYKFVPSGFWKYDETEGAGMLTFESLTAVSTFEDLVTYANDIFNAIGSSEDCGIMSGDTLKAYGADKIFKMDALLPEYLVIPVPNEEVLNQIQNLTIVGDLVADPDLSFKKPTIWQDTSINNVSGNSIMFRPITLNLLNSAPHFASCDRLLSVDDPVPNPATTMVATRLLAMGTDFQKSVEGITTDYVLWDTVGTELITTGYVHYFDPEIGYTQAGLENTFSYQPRAIANYASWLNYISKVACFDRHPAFYLFTRDISNNVVLSNVEFDISNYTFVSKDVMHRMHTTAILSLLNCPVMGAYSRKLK